MPSNIVSSQGNIVTCFSPAKINLFLNILQKRADGYHELETIMQTLDFGDDIQIVFGENLGIQMHCDHPRVPRDSSNLVWKAIDSFYQAAGIKNPGVSITLHKRIPVGSGLGGGSSNAGTVLKALNQWHAFPLSDLQLHQVAAMLGSDINFFLNRGTWFCTGRGERVIRKIESRRWTFLLLFPGFESSTQKVYERFILDLTKAPFHPSVLQSNLSQGSPEELEKQIHNSLREPFLSCYSQSEPLLKCIEQETSRKACVSGSGSTLFLICDDDENASFWRNRLEKIKVDTVVAHTQVE
jgi:4-diphosphocytidyl-2-C-methyl-D-erythritol kinase